MALLDLPPLSRIRRNHGLEHATIHGNYYGTPLEPLDEAVGQGQVVILAIDVQGAATLRRMKKDFLGFFVLPPSIEELRKRLAGRGDTPSAEVERRLAHAVEEMRHKDDYDVAVVNETVDATVRKIRQVLQERHVL